MVETFELIVKLVKDANIRISEHGYDELAEDSLFVREVIEGVSSGIAIEEYPDYHKGPCVLVLQRTQDGQPIHVVWGVPKGKSTPAVLVTAYRPNPERWSEDFQKRRQI